MEIPAGAKLDINFFLPEGIRDSEKEKKSSEGLRNYFTYTVKKLAAKKHVQFRNIALYGIFGGGLLFLAYLLQSLLERKYLLNILPEGLFIGGWVLFWEIFSIVFFKLRDITRRIRVYRRLRDSRINHLYLG
ncbi:MAG: hypothetical protein JXQ30_11230 [Spirochaetes bacterium]|nr:hypothetical protein [Spirochaetota bacterium]